MRFGINAISVVTGGNATYFANLLPELASLLADRGDTLFVYTREGGRVSVPRLPALKEVPIVPARASLGERLAREQLLLPRRAVGDRLDLFFGPGDQLPLAMPCPTVCAFRNPNIYTPPRRQPLRNRPRLVALRQLARAAARQCSRAIFVSATAQDEIVPVLGLPAEKAMVVHHGLGDVFREALQGPTPWERPYVLSVSTIYHYKNYVRLVEAYDRFVRQTGLPHGLAIVGAAVDAAYAAQVREEIARRGLAEDVRLVGEVHYPAVGAWYRHASAFIFPSFRETFGHPLLEAMAANLPLAAASIPVMHEIGGAVPRYFDPLSVNAMGDALHHILTAPNRDAQLKAGQERLQEFTWRRTAERTLRAFDESLAAASGGERVRKAA